VEENEILTKPVAISIIRALSGAPGYPFHVEGESQAAHVLTHCCISVSHARAVINEFDTDFPTLEQLRGVAFRLRPQFDPHARAIEDEQRKREEQERRALKGLHDSVPLIPGVPWEICLQIQCLRIAVQEAYKEQAYYLAALKDYPEAMTDIRAGLDPDPEMVEKRYRALHPTWRPRGSAALSALQNIVERTSNGNSPTVQ